MKQPTLAQAFALGSGALVSIVGGGGKTSLMFALAQALPGNVVMTTTTRIFAAQMDLAPAVCDSSALERLGPNLANHHSCLVVGAVAGEKAHGVALSLPGELLKRPDVDYVLVEADGSRMRPIKAPARHEPVVPPQTSLLVPVVGIDAYGKSIQEVAHRPEIVQQLLAERFPNLDGDYQFDADSIAALIIHPQGGLKSVPEEAMVIPFINKVETDEELSLGHKIARQILRQTRVAHVVIGAVRSRRPVRAVHSRVTAVVLAAGQSKRMGRTKQLLPWGSGTVLGQTLKNLKQSAIHDILVVTGHDAKETREIATAAGVGFTHNDQFATGEMLSSLKRAISVLPGERSAVLVMLADQPMVEPESIDRLLAAFWQGEGELIAPEWRGERGNPVLIGRSYFPELMDLPPDAAPRVLLRRHADEVVLCPVGSDSVLRDLDLPEDYQRWCPKPHRGTGSAPKEQ